ncbi:YciI family protein [Trichocoleus desertorum AS-A10]|uniref:YciI family protein n=1 Tax=Trichocoleus desertorum TaxID=1481672 RepID=UPI00329B02F3
MKYMLLIYMDENALSETEREHCYAESAQLAQELNAKGQYVSTAPLHPVATATSVRVRDGKSLITDGPFAETREQLGGFFLIDAQDLDEAIAIAAQIQEHELERLKFVRCLKSQVCRSSSDPTLIARLLCL